MGDLYVIRHAQASFGGADYDQLSELGFRQARLVESFFGRTGIRFQAIYSGSLRRQVDTAEPLRACFQEGGRDQALIVRPEFNEYDSTSVIQSQIPHLIREDPSLEEDLGRLQTDRRALQRILDRSLSRWISTPDEWGGLETWAAFNRRIREGIDQILSEGGRGRVVALVTSGGPLSVLLKMALSLSDRETIQVSWQVRNASISTFKYNRERLTLTSFNSVAHLEIEQDPGLITYR